MDKYEKLTSDLLAAFKATESLEKSEDGGTCNFDSPAISLPRWSEEKVEEAARAAGVGVFRWSGYGAGRYVFGFPTRCQGNARSRRADAISDFLRGCGYDCLTYYQMD